MIVYDSNLVGFVLSNKFLSASDSSGDEGSSCLRHQHIASMARKKIDPQIVGVVGKVKPNERNFTKRDT